MNVHHTRMIHRRGRDLALAASVPVLVAALSACSALPGGSGTLKISGTAGPAGAGATTASSAPGSAAPSTPSTPGSGPASASPAPTGASTTTGRSRGCPAGGTAIPAGAARGRTADLDGDGRPDTIWLADLGGHRTLGVRTASGAGFTTRFTSASPISATAYGGRVAGGAIILLDTGRSAAVYTVTGCTIAATLNAQGVQYTFDEGFTGYGSGAGCVMIGSTDHLAGYLAKGAGGERFDVTRTTVNLSDGGRRATNGGVVTLGRSLSASSAIVRTAQSVSCGSAPGVTEPS